MDKDVKLIRIIKSKHGFIVEILYTNTTSASFSVDGFDLKWVYDTIDRQNNEVHRATL